MGEPVSTSTRAKVLLVGGSVAATLLLAEFVLFPLLLPHTPLRLHLYLGDGIRPLAQSSKADLVPRDWIALVGDSYAQGRGDWLLSLDSDSNAPFHSAHVIARETGRDVVSLARGGTGALRGFVAEPIAKAEYLASSWRFRTQPPSSVIAYFYEGNDLVDTLRELVVIFGGADPAASGPLVSEIGAEGVPDYFRRALANPDLRDPEGFDRAVERTLLAEHPVRVRAAAPTLADAFPFADFLANVVRAELLGADRAALRSEEADLFPSKRQRPTMLEPRNALRVRGYDVDLAVELQGPAVELTAEETDAALDAVGRGLWMLRTHFAPAPVCLVYIPSPAAAYDHATETVVLQALGSRPAEYPSEEIHARSLSLRERMRAVAAGAGVAFLDTTPAVRRATQRDLLHGPLDMRHFNQQGYTLLGRLAARCLGGPA